MEKLYEKYLCECAFHLPAPGLTLDEFTARFGEKLAGMEHVSLCGPGGEGVLYYSMYTEGGVQVCDTPVFGYYASTEKAFSLLFGALVERVLAGGTTRFQVRLYAHDTQAQRLFAMMQFGYMAEKGICRIAFDETAPSDTAIRTLTKEEISARWPEIWTLTAAIIRHLQQPPVCYPGKEFTEEVYRGFFLDEDTQLHAAFSQEGRMIGIIESNREPDPFVGSGARSVNVGEVYTLPEYRGSGLAHRLLQYAARYEQARGATWMWVEHGTANPNARRFWGRYFSACQYEMDRVIEAW